MGFGFGQKKKVKNAKKKTSADDDSDTSSDDNYGNGSSSSSDDSSDEDYEKYNKKGGIKNKTPEKKRKPMDFTRHSDAKNPLKGISSTAKKDDFSPSPLKKQSKN